MQKIELDKKEFLKFLTKTKLVTGLIPSVSILSLRYKVCKNIIIRHLDFLEKDGKIKINRGKKGINFYNLK